MPRNSANHLFTLLLILISHFSFAQSKIAKGKHKLKHTTFKIDKIENTMVVLEENTKVRSGKEYDPKLWYGLTDVVYASKDDVKSAFVKVIGTERITKLPPKERVVIMMILNTQGKPSEVSYYLSDSSGLTLEDLDQLTVFIKENIRVKMPVVPGNRIATLSSIVFFDKIGKE